MTYSEAPGITTRRIPKILGTGLVVIVMATIGTTLGYQLRAFSSSTGASQIGLLLGEYRSALGADDGALPNRTTVFGDDLPGVANLDPDLLAALRQAATEAANNGVAFFVTSGWRSPEYQDQLLQEAVRKYGSEEEAARWVASPNTSAHVSGDAVDIGPVDAVAWLSEHGAKYGLCQIYRNEPWHFELRSGATERRDGPQASALHAGAQGDRRSVPARSDQGCPAMYADPTHDPDMQ